MPSSTTTRSPRAGGSRASAAGTSRAPREAHDLPASRQRSDTCCRAIRRCSTTQRARSRSGGGVALEVSAATTGDQAGPAASSGRAASPSPAPTPRVTPASHLEAPTHVSALCCAPAHHRLNASPPPGVGNMRPSANDRVRTPVNLCCQRPHPLPSWRDTGAA